MIRKLALASTIALAACGTAHARDPIVKGTPVVITGACTEEWTIKPAEGKWVSVQSGPSADHLSIDVLFKSVRVWSCGRRGDWLAVVYDHAGERVCKPRPNPKPYKGPCAYGWMHVSFLRAQANDIPQGEVDGVLLRGEGATRAFANIVKRYMDETPEALRNRIGPRQVTIFDNVGTFRKYGSAITGLSKQAVAKIAAADDFSDLYAKPDFSRTGIAPNFSFVQGAMSKYTPERQRRIVVHAMMVALDYELDISRSKYFNELHEKDKKAAFDRWMRASVFEKQMIDKYGDYLADAEEAWAEATARLVLPPDDVNDQVQFEALMPNVTAYARAILTTEGIIPRFQ